MDWDWEDGPPRDTPPPRRAPEPPPSGTAPEPPSDPPSGPPRREPRPEPSGPDVTTAPSAGAPPPRRSDDRAAARARRRRQVRQRRLIALAVIVVVVIALAVLLVRGCGGSASGGAAANPSPTPTALRAPTAKAPLRMAAYGESVGGGTLLGIKLLTEQRKDIKVHRFVKVATGLTRPDFFDWPAYLKQDVDKRKQPFEAVLLMFGANDGQDTKVDGKQLAFGTGSWKTMYAQRVGEVMDLYLERGVRKIYWAGMPRMGIGWFNDRMELMNGIYKTEVAKRAPEAEYIDAWTVVDAPAKTYQAEYRQEDGVHLTVDGGVKLAKAVLAAVAEDWRLKAFEEPE